MHVNEQSPPEFPSGKIAKNRLYYYRCFQCGREVRKMLRVMPVDDEIWTLRDLEVRLADLWMNVCNEQNVDYSFSVHHGMGGMQVQSGNRLHGFAMRERAKKKICVLSSAIFPFMLFAFLCRALLPPNFP